MLQRRTIDNVKVQFILEKSKRFFPITTRNFVIPYTLFNENIFIFFGKKCLINFAVLQNIEKLIEKYTSKAVIIWSRKFRIALKGLHNNFQQVLRIVLYPGYQVFAHMLCFALPLSVMLLCSHLRNSFSKSPYHICMPPS